MIFLILKISVKSSDIFLTVKAYRKLSEVCNYPLHLELLRLDYSLKHKVFDWYWPTSMEGIGDTIRVSLSSDPIDEVKAGYEILKSLGIRSRGVIYFLPFMCATSISVIETVKKLEKNFTH